MVNNKTTLKWSELYKLNVVVPSEGKTLGTVEDFYFQEGTNAIYALSVRTRLYGDLTLPVTGIKSIEDTNVAIPNAQMLLKAVPPYTRGQDLLARKVVDEDGHELGTVKDIILGINTPSTLRVVAFDMGNGNMGKRFPSDGVASYSDDIIAVYGHTAKKLR